MPEQFSRLERSPHKGEVSGSIPLFGTKRLVDESYNRKCVNRSKKACECVNTQVGTDGPPT